MNHPKPQRSFRGNPGVTRNMFLLSLILHLLVIALAMISISTPSRPLTFGGTYSVSLVSPEAVMSSRDMSALQEIMRPSRSAPAVIAKRETIIPQPETIKKTQDTVRTDIEKALSAIRQRHQASTDQTAQTQAPSSTPAFGPGSGMAGSSGLNEYSAFVQARVKSNWSLPDALRPERNTLTIIEVRIARSGQLEHIGFEKRSGNSYYDESALRAVKKSAPFPPLPEEFRQDSIEIGIRFPASELR